MKTIPSSDKRQSDLEQLSLKGIQESIYPDQPEINITDGGEFLDDSIRMKDQPLGEAIVQEDK